MNAAWIAECADDEMEYLRAEDRARRRAASTDCRCGDDMPGTCPGPAACPMCDGYEGKS